MTTVPEYTGDVPRRTQSQTAFNQNVQDILDYQVTLAPAINTVAGEVNTNATNAATSESNAAISETNALASANEASASANATVYSGSSTYDYPDTVIGSDGNAYRCLGTGVVGDNPVGSVTGDWLSLASVDLTSDQSINGVKTFVDSPVVPDATTATQPLSRGQVDVANSPIVKTALNATGVAPIYACRAWVNFDGVGVVTIRGSGNISSVTDGGIGTYNINFITSMEDVNYSIVGVCSASGSSRGVGGWTIEDGATRATNTTLIRCYDMGATGSAYTLTDSNLISVNVNR